MALLRFAGQAVGILAGLLVISVILWGMAALAGPWLAVVVGVGGFGFAALVIATSRRAQRTP